MLMKKILCFVLAIILVYEGLYITLQVIWLSKTCLYKYTKKKKN